MHRGIACLAPVPAVALVLAAGAGCAANGGDESMLVLKNVAPGADCKFTPAETETGISRGELDTSLGIGYLFTAQIKSRITAATGQADPRTILISGANVDIAFPSTLLSQTELDQLKTAGLTKFKSLFSSPLAPNGGLLDAQFELIPAELAVALDAKLATTAVTALVTFRVIGGFPGSDDELTSQAFQYPVTLRSGGLAVDKGPCAMLSSSFMARPGNSCNPGQDFVVDCCTAPNGVLECPAVGTGM
jgi:hypothetical protein